jgi:hypothetical protein
MGIRSVALNNLESARKNKFGGKPAAFGTVSTGSYSGQAFQLVAASRYFAHWYRVILKDERGHLAERDIRESCL